ncbi:MAG: nuclear transport factor 2 family protein [Burkholderiaceae bacterium]|nr:nuclear transport factor 2 family protein [Burkholderiaceae bacterium]
MPVSIPYIHCAQAIALFYHSLDQQDNETLLSCLAPDTVWIRQGKTLTGPDQILEALEQRNPDRITSHQFSNLHVALDKDGATAVATYYLTVYDNQHPSTSLQLKTILRSKDIFRRKNDNWLLAKKQSSKHL